MEINRLFTSISSNYDLTNTLITLGLMERWRRQVVREACPDGGRALDVATGTAGVALKLARKAETVVGVDFCQPMLYQGWTRAKKLGHNLHLVLGDALTLPFPDGVFDCATIAFGARNLPDVPRCFWEMRRVVRQGGRVLCLELSSPPSRLGRAFLRAYLYWAVPWIGGLLTGQRGAYFHLLRSMNSFPPAPELKKLMEKAGLRQVSYRFLFNGVALHSGIK